MDAPRPAVRFSVTIVEVRALGSHFVARILKQLFQTPNIIDENGTRDRVHQILGFGKVTAPSTAQDLPQDRPGPAKNPFGTRPRIRPGSIQGLGEGRADLVNAAGIFADICRLAKDISGPHCMLPSRLTSPG